MGSPAGSTVVEPGTRGWMSNPQQPEIGRSRKTPSQDPDSAAAIIEAGHRPTDDGAVGPVPPENQPGHHPSTEQDKPDLNAFAERLGIAGDASETAPGAAGRADRGRPLVVLARTPVLRSAAALVGAVAVLLLGRMVRRRRWAD